MAKHIKTPDNQLHPAIGEQLVRWFEVYGRKLPFRQTNDPYFIWLSEIIFQQTQIKQGLPYYNKFITLFPTVKALAEAPLETVLKAWEGLGYYSRARNLHKTAQIIWQEYEGNVPNTISALKTLPGIGDYTAHAIAAFAFGQAVIAVDGNVMRVTARLITDKTPVPSGKAYYQILANRLLGNNNPAKLNGALMDLGATICTPKNPICDRCPVSADCWGYATGEPSRYPITDPKRIRPERCFVFYLMERHTDHSIFLLPQTRPGVWQGLWQLPAEEVTPESLPTWNIAHTFRHEFTHYRLNGTVIRSTSLPATLDLTHGRWVDISEALALPLSKAMRSVLTTLFPTHTVQQQ